MANRLISKLGTIALCGAALVAMPVYAQTLNRDQRTETVTVTAPAYGPSRTENGAAIRNVSFSRAVRYDDLNLNTAHGVRQLHWRIQRAASSLCMKLDAFYPIAVSPNGTPASDSQADCVRRTVHEAMSQAEQAIQTAQDDAGQYQPSAYGHDNKDDGYQTDH